MEIYEELNVHTIINCSGKMTYLGSSVLSKEVGEAMVQAGGRYVSMDELMVRAGKKAAELCGSEDGMITCGASSGIIAAVAGIITGGNPLLTEQIPHPDTRKRQIILQKGHVIDFGAPIRQMIEVGGGIVREVGTVNKTNPYHIEESIGGEAAAILYVQSHHAVQTDMVGLKEVTAIAASHGIPVIVDAAAEEDLRKYTAAGADLVIYSGAKALEGPTSGLVVGKRRYIEMCRAQSKGVCRSMKVGKENIAGLLKAMMLYEERQRSRKYRWDDILKCLYDGLKGLSEIKTEISPDSAGRAISRLKITVNREACRITALELDTRLREGEPAVYARNHHADLGYIELDPRPMRLEDCGIVIDRIKEILKPERAE